MVVFGYPECEFVKLKLKYLTSLSSALLNVLHVDIPYKSWMCTHLMRSSSVIKTSLTSHYRGPFTLIQSCINK